MSKPKKKSRKKLDPAQIETLLKDAEATGKSRLQILLISLCEAKPYLFGQSGDETRRLIQKKWDLFKRKSPESYLKLLA
jgi:hypothetical protein